MPKIGDHLAAAWNKIYLDFSLHYITLIKCSGLILAVDKVKGQWPCVSWGRPARKQKISAPFLI